MIGLLLSIREKYKKHTINISEIEHMLRKEFTLTAQRILALSRNTELIAFFAELGYQTDLPDRTTKDMPLCNVLHTQDAVRRRIKAFTRVAEKTDETGVKLCVYLYVLHSSITAKTRQDIANDLRKLNKDDFLFILTDESYHQLEFVFLDSVPSSTEPQSVVQQSLFGAPVERVGARRVRSFAVDRRHPSRVALRFLRALYYTQRDVWEQCKAISRAYDTAETSDEFFNNHSLFSDYYLNERLPADVPEWGKDDLEDVYHALRRVYSGVALQFVGKPLAEIKTALFDQVLLKLGFPQRTGGKALKQNDKDGQSRPDYVFELPNQDGTSTRVICKVYPWGRVLDDYLVADEDDEEARLLALANNENPAAVIVSLLEQEQAHWAILSNGKTWRLYSPKARSRATNYYEVDLQEILTIRRQDADEALKALRYFWLFFRAASFQAVARPGFEHPPYISLLDFLMRESEQFARELGDSLKKRVFDEIFPFFAEGFVRYGQETGKLPQDMGALSDEVRTQRLKIYFEGTLTFLYRLLVLFYAESRALLPVYDELYHGYSLTSIKDEIKAAAGNYKAARSQRIEETYADDYRATTLYQRLGQLFKAIDQGDEELNVPAYNGGLFLTEVAKDKSVLHWTPDEEVTDFLRTHQIPDRYLAQGLDLMARDEDTKKSGGKAAFELVFVDYKTLGVHQLGSIYEGLLEFKLRIAITRMVEIKNKIMPLSEAIAQGLYIEGKTRAHLYEPRAVYIENDRHERKVTGSYYTPDYVVQYIIEQTIGPILQEKFAKLREKFRTFQLELANRQRQDETRRSKHMLPEGVKHIYDKYQQLAEEFFDIKVLDPAMGSGHFLVNAADYITDRMTEFLDKLKPNPIQFDLQKIRSSILQEVERQHVTIDRGRLTELNLLKRQVLKRCIYGVDVNPMAVTLTKVSLWLDTFTQGAPFSFLDHHIKCGNSLIGARVDEARKAIEEGQLSLLFGNNVWAGALLSTEGLIRVSRLNDVTPHQVRESQEEFSKSEEAIAPYKRLLNVYTSRWFGNPFVTRKKEQVNVDKALDFLRSTEAQEWVKNADHTKLNEEQKLVLSHAEKDAEQYRFFHWELEFPEVFIDLKCASLKTNPGFDAVIGNPPYRVLIRSQVGDDLIKYVNSVSESAQYNPNLFALMTEKAIGVSKLEGLVSFIVPSLWLTNAYFSQLRRVMACQTQLIRLADLGFGVFEEIVETGIFLLKRVGANEVYQLLLAKRNSSEQIDLLPSCISSEEVMKNIETGFFFFSQKKNVESILKNTTEELASSFIVYRGVETRDNQSYLSTERISNDYRAILTGTDVERYICEWTGTYVKFIPKELKSNADIIMYNVPEKVLLRRTGSQLIAGLDTGQLLALKNLYVIIPKKNLSPKFLLALLSSRLLDYYNQSILGNAGEVFAQLKKTDIEAFPIRRINFITPPAQRTTHLAQAKQLYTQYITKDNQESVLSFVNHHLSQQPEASDIVHDLLAFLAEEMMRLNKEKRTQQQAFLTWLVTTLKIQQQPDKKTGKVGIDALQGKARLLEYAGDYQKGEQERDFSEVKAILQDNKKRMGVYLSDSLLARVEEQYLQSLDKVLPLKRQLERTDGLIDQIVYRLYGLSEEERNIVSMKHP